MSESFNGAANTTHQPITTKAELDARLDARPTPKPEPQLTPNAWEAVSVNQTVNRLAEMRITELQYRLQSSRDMLERDHLKSIHKDRSKAGFNNKAQDYER
ncbi:MAG: hypothetical protein JKY46_08580 [Robiginitomaculum sp.]|nr:hypothetical protein [Robiginitomaculum sp.]